MLKHLDKAIKQAMNDEYVRADDFVVVFEAILASLKEFKKSNEQYFESLTGDNKATFEKQNDNIKQIVADIENKVKTLAKDKTSEIKDVAKQVQAEVKRLEQLIANVPQFSPDELNEAISQLEQRVSDFKLPDPDKPDDLVDKLNLAEKPISLSRIENNENLVDQERLERAISILDQRTQYLINKKTSEGGSLPPGGTTGQVLIKQSSADGDADWQSLPGGGDMLASVYDPANKAEQVLTIGDSSSFATSAQGTLADTATQPADIANFETTTQLNTRDTNNRARANHTGTQTASTISDFQTAVSANSDVVANTAARHDAVTLAGSPNYLTIAGQVITRALIDLANHVTGRLGFSNLPQGTARSVVGRAGSGNGDVSNISAGNDTILSRSGSGNVAFNNASTVRTILNVADGATANTGTVTSVAATVPTGLTITGSPVTTSGTLAIGLDTDRVIPTQTTLDGKAPLASPTFTGVMTYERAESATTNLGNLGTTETINFNTATHFRGTLDDDVTITISNVSNGQTGRISLYYTGAQRAVTFAGAKPIGTLPDEPSSADEVAVYTVWNDGVSTFISGGLADVS